MTDFHPARSIRNQRAEAIADLKASLERNLAPDLREQAEKMLQQLAE